MNIQGKVALVTGGAVRVGKAITLMRAAAGANVVVNYNASAEAAEETAAEARALGVEALAVQGINHVNRIAQHNDNAGIRRKGFDFFSSALGK